MNCKAPLLAGNWKMNHGPAETHQFFEEFTVKLKETIAVKKAILAGNMDVLFFPPSCSLDAACAESKNEGYFEIGAQNVHWEKNGAYTGEISTLMAVETGCRWVLVGHSERRTLFGETAAETGKKVESSIDAGLNTMLCVGETEQQREGKLTESVICDQITGALSGLDREILKARDDIELAIAYEPVWAIGTGKSPSSEDISSTVAIIRKHLKDEFPFLFGGKDVRILYGGSVKPDNASGIIVNGKVDGLLVGGASLKADIFVQILSGCVSVPVSNAT